MRGIICIAMMFLYCYSGNQKVNKSIANNESIRLTAILKPAKQFCEQRKLSTSVFFLVDMHIHSGKKRFFAIDMQHDSIIASGLVAHGVCGIFFSATAGFSNEPGLGCSSLGRYKIGNKYNGRFGAAYKLHGLDSTNSNAYKRNVVLHSYYEMPDDEIYPAHVPNSQGCPMVSKHFFKTLENMIDISKKPVLLWMVK